MGPVQDKPVSGKYDPIVAIAFDGCIHDYHGWNGPTPTGEPIPGSLEALRRLRSNGCRPVIFSTRRHEEIRQWLQKWNFPDVEITDKKPPFLVLVDDRAVTFDGKWTLEFVDSLASFQAHWEKGIPTDGE